MKKIIYFLVIISFCLVPSSLVFAYDEVYSHPYLTKLIIAQWAKTGGFVLSDEEQAIIVAGSQAEDNPTARSLNHFYNPLNKQGLSIDKLIVGYATPDWLIDKTKQNEPLFEGSFTWDEGVEAYKKGDPSTPLGAGRARALTILGHSLHLLEDMAMPAHTRNDEHVEGDSYESWIKEQNSLGGQELFWDQRLWHTVTCAKPQDCLRDLAKFTNANFFSRDTINDPNFSSPKNKLVIGADGYARANGRMVAFLDKNTKTLILTPTVLRANWRALTPELISYGVRLMNLFLTAEPRVLVKNKITPRISEGGVKIKNSSDALYLNSPTSFDPNRDLTPKNNFFDRWWPIIDFSQTIPREFLGSSPPIITLPQVAGQKIEIELKTTVENKNESLVSETPATPPSASSTPPLDPPINPPTTTSTPPVVTPDTQAPQANFIDLASSYPDASWTLNWQGSDNITPGSSLNFDLDFKMSSDWANLMASTTASSTIFSAPLADGAKVNFRLRATDEAGNIGAWQEAITSFIEPNKHNPLLYEKLEHLYHFSECSGSVAHDTLTNSDLNISIPWVSGPWDCGVEQDWVEAHYMSAMFNPLTTSELTWSFWMKDVSGPGTFSRNRLWLFDNSRSYTILQIRPTTQNIRIMANHPYDYYGFYDKILNTTMPLDHNWHSVILTVNKNYFALYIDGALAEKIDSDFAPSRAITQMVIVGENAPTQFDEIALWSRTLSSEEIIAYYNVNKPLKP